MKTLFSLQLNRIDKIFLLIMGVLLIIGVFTLILMIANRGHGKVILKRHIKKYEYNVRFYSFDYSANLISYFDRKDIKRKITQSIDYFYKQFPSDDVENVKNWLANNINDSDKASEYLETKVYLRRNKEIASSLFELTSINRTKKIVHFESHLLPYLSYQTKKKKKNRNYIKTLPEILVHSEKHRLNGKGGIILIKLFSAHSYELDEKTINPIMIQLVNYVAQILNENRFLINLTNFEIAVVDYALSSRAAIVGLANRIKQLTDTFLTINSLSDNYELYAGLVLNENLMDLKSMIGHARDMAILAEQKEEIGFELYDSNKDYASMVSSVGYRDIVTLIHNKTFRFYFTPIINADKLDIIAYKLTIDPYGTNFENINEIFETANELRLLHPILKTTALGAINQIGKLNETVKIMFTAQINYINDYLRLFINEYENISPVVCFHEDDLVTYNDEYDDLAEKLVDIIDKKLSVALIIDNELSELTEDVLSKFDYFLTSKKLSEELTLDNRTSITLRTLIDQYSVYKGDFIVQQISSIDNLEIALRLGVKNFSCSAILDASSTLEKLDEDTKEKIEKIKS